MSLQRKQLLSTLFFIGLLSIVFYGLYWWFARIPWGWKTYTHWKGYRYSFAHPKDWIVSECGNGSVVVGKKSVERCYFPLNAPKEYLDNLYFHIFLPHQYLSGSVHTGLDIPRNLDKWESMTWILNDDFPVYFRRYLGISIPVSPNATNSSMLQQKSIVHPNRWFSIGYIPEPSFEEELRMVIKSMRLF